MRSQLEVIRDSGSGSDSGFGSGAVSVIGAVSGIGSGGGAGSGNTTDVTGDTISVVDVSEVSTSSTRSGSISSSAVTAITFPWEVSCSVSPLDDSTTVSSADESGLLFSSGAVRRSAMAAVWSVTAGPATFAESQACKKKHRDKQIQPNLKV